MANPLKGLSDEELLEELCRRQRVRTERDERLAFKPCEECKHYVFWIKGGDPPTDYNGCAKGHEMKFRMPTSGDPRSEEYGFYRRVCGDREPRGGNNQPREQT